MKTTIYSRIIIVLAVLASTVMSLHAEFPYFHVDSILDTRDMYMRAAYCHMLPEFKPEDTGLYNYRGDTFRDSLTMDPMDVKLVYMCVIPRPKKLVDQYTQLYRRVHSAIRFDPKTNKLALRGPLGKMSPELKKAIMDDIEFQNAVIDSFIADGYTPHNIVSRLANEGRYLCMPYPYWQHLFGWYSNWVFAGHYFAVKKRMQDSKWVRNFPNSTSQWVDRGTMNQFYKLPKGVTPQQMADSLNVSIGTLYCAACSGSMSRSTQVTEPLTHFYNGLYDVTGQVWSIITASPY